MIVGGRWVSRWVWLTPVRKGGRNALIDLISLGIWLTHMIGQARVVGQSRQSVRQHARTQEDAAHDLHDDARLLQELGPQREDARDGDDDHRLLLLLLLMLFLIVYGLGGERAEGGPWVE